MLVELAAEVREPRIVGGFQGEIREGRGVVAGQGRLNPQQLERRQALLRAAVRPW
jgi:hypothetical protein